MTAAAFKPQQQGSVSEAARQLGKLGGRPKGSFSSPLSIWLRAEARQRQREGYRARESFVILRDTEHPDGRDAFTVSDHTADEHDLDIDTQVTWDYFKKIWKKSGGHKPVSVPYVRRI